MRRWVKDVPLSVDEVRALLNKEEKQSKWVWIGIGVSIVCSLIAISLWICNKRQRDMEDYFEYFDDEDFGEDFDDEDYAYSNDLDHEVEYVELNGDEEDLEDEEELEEELEEETEEVKEEE